MARNIELLLLRNIENLGIVGDMVKVKPGYARNYLLPHALAEFPTAAKIEALKDVRAKALAEVATARKQREELLGRMTDVSVAVVRSCNDQGVLYGAISQRDISDALSQAGFGVDTRAVRLAQPIRRVGSYHVPIQLDKDLKIDITLVVQPDRQLEAEMKAAEAEAEAAAARAKEGDGEGATDEGGKPGDHQGDRRGDKRADSRADSRADKRTDKASDKPADKTGDKADRNAKTEFGGGKGVKSIKPAAR